MIYTIGHSNRTLPEFLQQLKLSEIQKIVDVRAQPFSRRFPHFNRNHLQRALNEVDIDYVWLGEALGGLRETVAASLNLGLHQSVRGFADYLSTTRGNAAIDELIAQCAENHSAIMCAELLPENCHRNIISDYLTVRGFDVVHWIDVGNVRAHELNSLVRRADQALIYDVNTNFELLLV